MTAVIGIINKSAAAIAADSAVTVNGPRGPKIFNHANKIFQLSKKHPVGLMIYNNGEFLGTPWEVVIKQYRLQLNETSFPTLAEYKDDFVRYLHAKNFFSDAIQQKLMLYYMICDFLNVIFNEVTTEQNALIQAQPPDLAAQLAECVKAKIADVLTQYEALADFSPEMADFTEHEFDAFGFTGLPSAVTSVFNQNGIPVAFIDIQANLKRLTYFILKSKKYFNFFSGLVFSGFGDDEYFPGLISINVSIAINNRLRYYQDDSGTIKVTHQNQSAIRPFAQKDVIDTILSGIDPRLGNLYFHQFDSFIRKNNETIAQHIEAARPDLAAIVRAIDSTPLTAELQKLVSAERKKHYIDPLMVAVGTLSKEDLAEMAESLIYLTYLKRRFTFAEESVGGPVDVAIITKGDGFIWIKRKHYFKKELNPHYFKNH